MISRAPFQPLWLCELPKWGLPACSCLDYPFSLFEDRLKVCLSPVVEDLPWSLQAFKHDIEQSRYYIDRFFRHPRMHPILSSGLRFFARSLTWFSSATHSPYPPWTLSLDIGTWDLPCEGWGKEDSKNLSIICICWDYIICPPAGLCFRHLLFCC